MKLWGMTASSPHLEVAAELRAIGLSTGYASMLARGHRPSDRKAVEIWRKTGLRLGRLARLTDQEIEVFAKALEAA